MKLTDHKTRSVFDRDNIASRADLAAAAQRLATAIDAVIAAEPEPAT
jgi:hypothetical protein